MILGDTRTSFDLWLFSGTTSDQRVVCLDGGKHRTYLSGFCSGLSGLKKMPQELCVPDKRGWVNN